MWLLKLPLSLWLTIIRFWSNDDYSWNTPELLELLLEYVCSNFQRELLFEKELSRNDLEKSIYRRHMFPKSIPINRLQPNFSSMTLAWLPGRWIWKKKPLVNDGIS